jgi:hypothetical protein
MGGVVATGSSCVLAALRSAARPPIEIVPDRSGQRPGPRSIDPEPGYVFAARLEADGLPESDDEGDDDCAEIQIT